MNNPRPKVALLVETSNAYARGLLRGVAGYLQQARPWSVYLAEHERGDQPPSWLAEWDGDGIIARIENAEIARAVQASGLPVVDVSAARLIKDVPWVETNDEAIADAAVEHLMSCGFKHFGFCGTDRYNWSTWRQQAFVRAVEAAGKDVQVFSSPADDEAASWEERVGAISTWLESVPRPIGILACYDIRGVRVLEACRRLGLDVPDEVAVLGVDNDEVLCNLADPPLSSVESDTYRTGFIAAELMDSILQGENVEPVAHLIDPIQVVHRRSTDVLAIEDGPISIAMRYIRDHAREGINVQDVLKQIPMSRRVFEKQFKELVGSTPHAEIDRVKLKAVKELLRDTDLSLERISELCGFKHSEYLSAVFKRKVGEPPSAFRTRHQR
jgi:LacI family transcriptional regulator